MPHLSADPGVVPEHWDELSHAYRDELSRLRPSLRRIKDRDVASIVNVLCFKCRYRVIKSARSLRQLRPLFRKASINERALHRFLSDPDMTIPELELCLESDLALDVSRLVDTARRMKRMKIPFTPEQRDGLKRLRTLLDG